MPRITSLDKKRRVFELRRQEMTLQTIAIQLNLARSTVQSILKKGEINMKVTNVGKCGRKPKLTRRQKKRITIESKKFPFMTANQIRTSLNLKEIVSVDTVKRSLRESGLFGRISAKKPHLTSTQIKRRLDWCKNLQGWNNTNWSKVIFSDECPLYLNGVVRQNVRRPSRTRKEDRYLTGTVKFPKVLMIWGAVRYDGKRVLGRCNGNVDSAEYQRVLNESLPQIYTTRYLYQHDGAPCHRSASTVHYLEQKWVRILQNWPAQSPDLNIIENLWSIAKEKLKTRNCTTLDDTYGLLLTTY